MQSLCKPQKRRNEPRGRCAVKKHRLLSSSENTPMQQPGGVHLTSACDTSGGGGALGTTETVKKVLSQCDLTAALLAPINQCTA